MTKSEAITALDEGKRLTHTYFSKSEWVKRLDCTTYEFEDGCRCSVYEFWATHHESMGFGFGWSEFVND